MEYNSQHCANITMKNSAITDKMRNPFVQTTFDYLAVKWTVLPDEHSSSCCTLESL